MASQPQLAKTLAVCAVICVLWVVSAEAKKHGKGKGDDRRTQPDKDIGSILFPDPVVSVTAVNTKRFVSCL